MPSLSDILYSLRYQILTSQVTSMGPCEVDGCKNSARGGAMCAACRTVQLGKLIGNVQRADYYTGLLILAQEHIERAEDIARDFKEA